MPLPQPPIADTDAPKIGPLDLFLAFSQLAMSGFGGVLPWAHRTLVERKGWLTQREFLDALALGQLLPGPNIGNMAVMIGYRFAGYTGAAAAFAGLVAGPFLLMIAAGLAYQTYGALPLVQQALSGMSAVAAGLVLATGLKMSGSLKRHWRPWLFTALALAGVGALRWPLLAVVGALAPFAIAAAWREQN
ncbi:MAG: chromate transporter [Betaproteobacteria bacterium]|nr:chromate transporter [Betaproteobacteria bacterium]